MGSFYLILGLIFSLLIAIIALANNGTVSVSYLFGRAEVSLILLILSSAFVGAIVMALFSIFRSIKNAFAFRDLRHQQDQLQKQNKAMEEEITFLNAELSKYKSAPQDQEELGQHKAPLVYSADDPADLVETEATTLEEVTPETDES